MIGVTENLRKIRDLLAKSAAEAQRDPAAVKLLAVSKKQSVDKILEAARSGHRDFGENFVQEGLAKIEATSADDLVWHFIGHLQTNKTRDVAEHFDWVHTIDRQKTAKRLSRQRPAESRRPLEAVTGILVRISSRRVWPRSKQRLQTTSSGTSSAIYRPTKHATLPSTLTGYTRSTDRRRPNA